MIGSDDPAEIGLLNNFDLIPDSELGKDMLGHSSFGHGTVKGDLESKLAFGPVKGRGISPGQFVLFEQGDRKTMFGQVGRSHKAPISGPDNHHRKIRFTFDLRGQGPQTGPIHSRSSPGRQQDLKESASCPMIQKGLLP